VLEAPLHGAAADGGIFEGQAFAFGLDVWRGDDAKEDDFGFELCAELYGDGGGALAFGRAVIGYENFVEGVGGHRAQSPFLIQDLGSRYGMLVLLGEGLHLWLWTVAGEQRKQRQCGDSSPFDYAQGQNDKLERGTVNIRKSTVD
jgi:hypothetical protein